MPSYPKGTRQWAEARMAQIAAMNFDPTRALELGYEAEMERMSHEYQELADSLASLPDGTPTYTREELEAAGQERLL